MDKSRLRGSGMLKAIAFLLSCALAACLCAAVTGGWFLYQQRLYYQNNAWETKEVYAQMEDAKEYCFLHWHRDALTVAGQSRYDELTRALSDKYTNFRFECSRTSDAAVLLSNLPAGNGEYDIVATIDSTDYKNAMGCMLAYYLDMTRTEDWTVRTGTAREWADTSMASRYYYTRADYEQILQNAGRTDSDGPEDSGYTEVDSASALEEEENGATAEFPALEEDAGAAYVYFVYTGDNEAFWLSCGVDRTYPVEDTYSLNATRGLTMESYFQSRFPMVLAIGAGALALLTLLLGYLTWSLGWDRAGVLALRAGNRMPIEVAAALGGGMGLIGLILIDEVMDSGGGYTSVDLAWRMLTVGACALPVGLGAVLLWTVLAAQCKTHTLAKQSILAWLWRWLRRWTRLALRTLGRVLLTVPLYWKAAAGCGAFWLAWIVYYFIIETLFGYHHLLLTVFWLTLPLLPLGLFICKWAADWNRLQKGARELVSGRLDYKVDTKGMLPDLRRHGEELNSLSEGLSLALEERIRGERFKTELITNVSHDLKTPLTSIINYVDLLKQTDIQDETARGYIEVLERKSQRLKTLTEDLVEASKAASGTLAVHLERLDLGQLVSQAVAEYDERLSNAGLTPVLHLSEEPCPAMADGRHLWRVLDNLLGNCTKYALPGTRVYLDVERLEGQCRICVKNISADPLNVPAEELMKRFVRGDSARSTQGSGLGLSIARNLTNAQGGSFDLVVDGDLFKAVITFPLAE